MFGTTLVVLLGAAVYGIFRSFEHIAQPPPPPGCQAGTGAQALQLDTDQAGIAATIAGVAARHKLPRRAVTVAYAAALQESQMHNLTYGDRDSVGVFQQRPSQGWGTASQLTDPVYATTRFFAALVTVRGYAKLPVDQAAQAVQHSADGSAYQQFAQVAAQLSGYFTGAAPHEVSCWYTPDGKADLTGAVRGMTQAFGPDGDGTMTVRITTVRSGQKKTSAAVVHAQQDLAWTVAGWLVAHAEVYGITQVRYASYYWNAAQGTMGWQREPPTQGSGGLARNTIVAG